MNKAVKISLAAAGAAVTLGVFAVCAKSCQEAPTATTSKSSEASVVTNDNGSVSRTFTECTVTTNGNMVTQRRRETRTTMDDGGNVLATSTSEYVQSYSAGECPATLRYDSDDDEDNCPKGKCAEAAGRPEPPDNASFMGLKFGVEFVSTNFVKDADEPTLLCTKFAPATPLAGFDDYYVYVTPKTHKIVKVFACAKNAVEPTRDWRRHYLVEALEKRYSTWARPRSWCRPIYSFELGDGRHAVVVLDDATVDYATVISAWDDDMIRAAADEYNEQILEQRKAAADRRKGRVDAAAKAF